VDGDARLRLGRPRPGLPARRLLPSRPLTTLPRPRDRVRRRRRADGRSGRHHAGERAALGSRSGYDAGSDLPARRTADLGHLPALRPELPVQRPACRMVPSRPLRRGRRRQTFNTIAGSGDYMSVRDRHWTNRWSTPAWRKCAGALRTSSTPRVAPA
jgi:hypothetical protein